MSESYADLNVSQTYDQLPDSSYLVYTEAMDYGLDILTPSNSSVENYVTSGNPSPMSTSMSPSHTFPTCITLSNVTMPETPCIEIIEQPVDKFRFRYKSEMKGSHGSLASVKSSRGREEHGPSVELKNYPGTAVIRCFLVTADPDRRGPHAHRLVREVGKQLEDDPHEISVSPELGFVVSFNGMGIIHTAKKHIKDELVKKKRFMALEEARRRNVNEDKLSIREETTIKMEAEGAHKWMGLNSVALCFQALSPNANGVLTPITDPVYSTPINNLKSALTGELKICRIDKIAGSCDGNDEVFMLVEKVGKNNIKIKFFEMDQDDQEIWFDYGRFTELDVHHQYAIVFKTPRYQDTEINEPRGVFIQLERKTDGYCSEPVKFTYKPSGRMIKGRKRPRTSFKSTDHPTPTISSIVDTEQPSLSTSFQNQEETLIGLDLDEHIDISCTLGDLGDTENLDEWLWLNTEGTTTDGPSDKKESHSFAQTIVKKIKTILKSGDPKVNEGVSALLKERTIHEDSALHFALRHNHLNLVKCILSVLARSPIYRPIINCRTSSGRTCLHYAVEQNQPDVTKALLLLGADANACDEHGFSPLHVAVKIPEAGQCVEMLLKGGNTNIEACDDAGWTALHLAAEAGSLKAIEALVKANVDVNSTDMSYGRTALHIAVEGGHKEIVEFLLTKTKIDVNKRNFSGNTALHSAVVNTGERASELCKLLIHHGANPSIANNIRNSAKESRRGDEMDSDDEADLGQEPVGQTSFDLAEDKPEILQLFAGTSPAETGTSTSRVATDEEVVGDVEDFEEGTGCSLLDEDTMSLLVPILDKSKCWKRLAKFLGYDFLQSSLQNSLMSPTQTLLTYLDLQTDIPIEELRTLLVELKETEAVEIIDEMLTRRSK